MDITEFNRKSTMTEISDIISSASWKNQIYVLYSGGCDSTLVLHKALLIAKNRGVTINTVSFKSMQLGGADIEAKKREKYFEYCKKEALPIGENLTICIDNDGSNGFKTGYASCPQPAIWTYNLLAYLPTDSFVLTGYIHGDDYLTHDIYSKWYQIYNGMNHLFDKKIEVYCPLAFTSKNEVISELRCHDIEKYTSYCEMPSSKGKPCGSCASCLKHKAYSTLVKVPKKRKNNEILKSIEKVREADFALAVNRVEVPGIEGPSFVPTKVFRSVDPINDPKVSPKKRKLTIKNISKWEHTKK